jgi:hypothetical protein
MDIPDDIWINSSYVELLTQTVEHQLAYVLEHSPRIETDGEGIIKHAVKDARKHAQRLSDAQTMAVMYLTIRKVGYFDPKLARVHTSAHMIGARLNLILRKRDYTARIYLGTLEMSGTPRLR